jgi:hypothetical protein
MAIVIVILLRAGNGSRTISQLNKLRQRSINNKNRKVSNFSFFR